MSLSQAQKQAIRERAGACCEYCRLPASAGTIPFHVDHFIPLKHDGSDDADNLCFACFNCNMYKSHDLTGFDPDTGEITPLFNPRQHVWSEHFNIEESMLIQGLSPEGRTTGRVLQFNLDERVQSRQVLSELGVYPCNSSD